VTDSIPVFKPLLEAEEIEASRAALELGWLGMGSYVGRFEEALEQYLELDDRYVVAVSTGHAALHLALMLMGVGPGDEVITPSFNNITDFQAILAVGAEPVLCDVRDDTLCIDVEAAAQLVTPRTKAIIAMDYATHLCDHRAVQALAEQHRLRVIHDAAHAFGSRWYGAMVGSFSDVTMFSFDPIKTITSIDGGALVVRSPEERTALHEMRLVGMGQPTDVMYTNNRAWTYDVRRLGFRYHLANMHAAIGLAQLEKIDRISASRRATCELLERELAGVSVLRTPGGPYDEVTPFIFYVRVPAERRDDFREHLHANGVDTGVHWQPGHWFALLSECRRGDLMVTERVGHEILSLPMHSSMPDDLALKVARVARSFFK
jgi:dTDP-4-amino-4,6-dideoxygalactose transaminase